MGRWSEFIFNHWALFGALIIIFGVLIFSEFKRKVLGFKDVKPLEAVKMINHESALVLDVREDKEYDDGHILNARHVPLGLLEGRLQELEPYKGKPVILCCQTGQRAAHAGVILRKQGFTHLYKLGGGMMSWKGANLPVAKRKG